MIHNHAVAFLALLKDRGLTLGARQRLANDIGRVVRGDSAAQRDAASEASAPTVADAAADDALRSLLARGDRDGAHQLLKDRGVRTVGDRQRIVSDALQALTSSAATAGVSTAAIADSSAREAEVASRPRFASAAEAIASQQVALITLTNSGYLAFTVNCLLTLDTVGEAPPLTVYCADGPSLARLRESAAAAQLVPMHEEALATFLQWKEKGWARLMWLKCEAMRRALATHEFVVFTDGDITYERRGAIAYCVDVLLGRGPMPSASGAPPPELVMQNDGMLDSMKDGWGLCAGFMAARRTPATLGAFTVDEAVLTPGWDDQRHLNSLLDQLRVHALPLELFPNGQYYKRHEERLARARPGPYLVHWNWLVGGEKRKAMVAASRWYVGEEWDAPAREEQAAASPAVAVAEAAAVAVS